MARALCPSAATSPASAPPPPPLSLSIRVPTIVGDDLPTPAPPPACVAVYLPPSPALPPPAACQFGTWNGRPLSAAPSPRPAGGLPPGRCRKSAPPPAPVVALVRLPTTSQLAASLQGPGGIEKAGRSFCQSRSPTSSTTSSATPWQSLAHSWASQDSALRPRSARLSGETEGSASSPSPTRPASGRARPLSARARPLSPGGSPPRKQQPPSYGGVWPHGNELTVWQGEARRASQDARGRHEAGDVAQHGTRAAVDEAQQAARLGARGGTGPGVDLDLVTTAYAPSARADHALSPSRSATAAPAPPVHSPPRPATAAPAPPVQSLRRPATAAPAPSVHSPRAPLVVPHVSGLLLGWRYPGEAAPGQLRGHSPRRSGLLADRPPRQTALLSGLPPQQQGPWCAYSGLPAGGSGTGLVPARQPVGPPVMESSTATMHHRPAYGPKVHAHVLAHVRPAIAVRVRAAVG